MDFNEMKKIEFSTRDIGYSQLLNQNTDVYTYHDMELYFIPLTMDTYEDPLFSVSFPLVGTVIDITDKEDESLIKDLGKLKILPGCLDVRTDGKDFYVKHWHMIIKIAYIMVSNPFARSEMYRTLIHHPEFEKEFTEVIKPTKTVKTLYNMVCHWTRIDLIAKRHQYKNIICEVTTLENRLIRLGL